MDQPPSVNPMGQAAALAAARPRYKFIVPETSRAWPSDPKVVVLREITISEETQAATRAGGGALLKHLYECLKYAIVSADGVNITWEDGGKERFLEGCSPKVATLLVRAYNHVHQPQEEDSAAFLSSATTVV
jgi:hypothetical protein